jgi:hypothetical protein
LIQAFVNPSQYLHQHYLQLLSRHWPILVAITAIVPFFVYDTIRFSHRFAGPISRLRRELSRFEQGADVFPIEFRKGDFWRDVVERINNVVERAETAEKKLVELNADSPATLPACELSRDTMTNEGTLC